MSTFDSVIDLALKAVAGKRAGDIKKAADITGKALGVLTATEEPEVPELPTMETIGIPDYKYSPTGLPFEKPPEKAPYVSPGTDVGFKAPSKIGAYDVPSAEMIEATEKVDPEYAEKLREETLYHYEHGREIAETQRELNERDKLVNTLKEAARKVKEYTYWTPKSTEMVAEYAKEQGYSPILWSSPDLVKQNLLPQNLALLENVNGDLIRNQRLEEYSGEFEVLPIEKKADLAIKVVQNKIDLMNKATEEQKKRYKEWADLTPEQKMEEISKSAHTAGQFWRRWYGTPEEEAAAIQAADMWFDPLLSFTKGAIGAASLGISDVIGLTGPDYGKMEPIYEQNQQIIESIGVAKAVAGAAGIIAGGLPVYGFIAGKVQQLYRLIPGPLGNFLANTPVLSTYVLSNAGEEVVEMGIRKGTGQQYDFSNFMSGMMMGIGFRGILDAGGWFKFKASVDDFAKSVQEMEANVRNAEVRKGALLDPWEVRDAVTPVYVGNKTMGEIFVENRLAYLKETEGRPGIEVPAKIPDKSTAAGIADVAVKIKDMRQQFKADYASPRNFGSVEELRGWLDERFKEGGFTARKNGKYVVPDVEAVTFLGDYRAFLNRLYGPFPSALVPQDKDFAFYKQRGRPGIDYPAPIQQALDANAKSKGLPDTAEILKNADKPGFREVIRPDLFERHAGLAPKKPEFYIKGETPASMAQGDVQALKEKGRTAWDMTLREFTKEVPKMSAEDAEAIGSYIDNPDVHPLPPHLRNLEAKAIPMMNDLTRMLTKDLQLRGLLENVVEPDNYLRGFLVQLDGSEVTHRQLAAMKKGTSASIMKTIFGLELGGKGKGLSVTNRYDVARMFENADEADMWLKQFGMKRDRNVFRVMTKYINQATMLASNYDFRQSLRFDGKRVANSDVNSIVKMGVVEFYDPEIYRSQVNSMKTEAAFKRDELLTSAFEKKVINEAEYKASLEQTKEWLAEEKMLLRDVPSDEYGDIWTKILDEEYRKTKEDLFSDAVFKRKEIAADTAKELKKIGLKTETEMTALNDAIRNKAAGLVDDTKTAGDEFHPISHYTTNKNIVNAFPGLLFGKVNGRAVARLFEEIGGDSFWKNTDDLVKIFKTYQATFDVFQIKEIIQGAYAVGGLKEIPDAIRNALPWHGMDADTRFEMAYKWARDGLLVEKPTDQVQNLFKQMGTLETPEDLSSVKRFYEEVIEKLSTSPGSGPGVEMVKKIIKTLEDYQWQTKVPEMKLMMAEKISKVLGDQHPELDPRNVNILTARFINDSFQGINFERLMATDTWMGRLTNRAFSRGARLLVFGPDRLISVINRYTKGIGRGPEAGLYRAYVARSILGGLTVLQAMNYAFTGHSTLENTKGGLFELEIPQITDKKGNPVHVNIMGTWAEPLKAIYSPFPYSENKRSLLLSSLDVEGRFGKTWQEWLWDVTPVPFGLKGPVESTLGQLFTDPNKPKTGQTDPVTGMILGAGEFFGLPTVFRSGKNTRANIGDMITGRAGPWEYLTGQDVTGKTPAKQKSSVKILVRPSNKPKPSGQRSNVKILVPKD